MRHPWFVAAVLSLCSLTAEAAHTLTHEDLWLTPRMAAPVISPDGKRAVVLWIQPAYDPLQQRADLWLIDTEGKQAPRQLTQTADAESGYQFSPSGEQIVFSAQRIGDAVAQIYLLELVGGGEAVRLTDIASGARNPVFSPDGQSILFISSVDITPAADKAANEKSSARIYEEFPIRFWDKWLERKQLRIFVQRIGEPASARDLLADTALVKQPGFGGRQGENTDELDAVWTPDGQAVVFVASSNRHLGASQHTNANLYQLGLNGGEASLIAGVTGEKAGDNYSRPRFAPNGKTLAVQVEARTEHVYNPSALALIPWPKRDRPLRLDAPLEGSVSSFTWAYDSKSLSISVEERGLEKIWRLPLKGTATRITTQTEGVYTNVVAATRAPVLLAAFDSVRSPLELVRIGSAGHRALTAKASARAKTWALSPAEHFTTEFNGQSIHSLLIKPANFDPTKKYPLFVLIHGGPHIAWRDSFFLRWNYHLLAGDERVVLLSNYKGSTGYGSAFARAIQGDPLKGPAEEINAAADAAIARFSFIDGSRQCAGGASYGGHLANWLQASTTRYRCLISHAGLSSLASQWRSSDLVFSREANMAGPSWQGNPLWSAQDPMQYVENFKTPVLVSFGELDYRVPINNGIEYWSMLKRQRVQSRLIVFPDENHWILKGENSRLFYRELELWLKRWMP